jgi:large subunit ribosomal protein L30
MAKLRITQIKSGIDRPATQKRTLIALGIRKMNVSVEHEDSKPILGMIHKIKHLVKVETI